MAKAEATVEELVAMIQRGDLRLPEMQREYVWRSTRVRDLLDSLYRGYPSGAILLWETDDEVPLRELAVEQKLSAFQTARLLLDGQQRLTSLSSVLRGEPVKVRGRTRPIQILFNLNHPDSLSIVTEVHEEADDEEEPDESDSSEDELTARFNRMAFVVGTTKLAALPYWVKVSDVLNTDSDAQFLKKAGVKGLDDPDYTKFSQRLQRLRGIRKYVYRMDVLQRSLSYEEVTEIFVRVNSLGAKLRSSDLALAQITAKWRGSLAAFQEFQQTCAKGGFDLELGLHLKTLVAMATGQSRFLRVGTLSRSALEDAWAKAKKGIEFALNFLRSNVRIDSPALLSSPFLIVTIAFLANERKFTISAIESEALRRWTLLANAKGRYSRGSSETLLDQDLASIRAGQGIQALVDRLRQQVGRLDVTPAELEGRNARSAVFKTMFLAFRAKGAKDWKSNLAISLTHAGHQHQLEFHHIFPRAVLKQHDIELQRDDIANLAFISSQTNKVISDRPPAQYVPALIKAIGVDAFRNQAIPATDASLLVIGAFPEFLKKRRAMIADMLNEFLGHTDQKDNVQHVAGKLP